jgi:uncharacterized protein YpmB
MKKLTFAVAACAMFAFAACSNSAENADSSKIDTLRNMSGLDSAYVIKGGKSDGTDSTWLAEATDVESNDAPKTDTLRNVKGVDSAYVIKGGKADGTDSMWNVK